MPLIAPPLGSLNYWNASHPKIMKIINIPGVYVAKVIIVLYTGKLVCIKILAFLA